MQINQLSRRDFLRAGAIGAAGLSLPKALYATDPKTPHIIVNKPGVSQKPLIIVWCQGGPSHIDLWDPKPEAPDEIRGPFNSIDTAVPGVQFSELLPRMASIADQIRVVRCMTSLHSEHGMATSHATTGSSMLENDKGDSLFNSPKYTSAHIELSDRFLRTGPGLVTLNSNFERSPYGGVQAKHIRNIFVECDFDVNDTYRSPFGSNQNVKRALEILELRSQFQGVTFDRTNGAGNDYDVLYESARQVLGRNMHQAFNLNDVSDEDRRIVGRGPFANSAIVATKLVKAGAPLVFLNNGFWDSHGGIENDLKKGREYVRGFFGGGPRKFIAGLGPTLDRVLFYLYSKLKDEAVIVVAGEFGRTPKMNAANGRDHWTNAFSMAVFGAGVEPGIVGETDSHAAEVIGKVGPFDSATTMEVALNAAGYMRIHSRDGSIPQVPIRFETQPGF